VTNTTGSYCHFSAESRGRHWQSAHNVGSRSCSLPRRVLPTSTAQTDGEIFARWRCKDTDSGVYFKPPGLL